MMAKLAAASLKEIESKPELLDFARALGKRAFADNCAPCHGAGGGGAKGYPNLNDNKWLWGGSLDADRADHHHGVRAGDDAGHQGAMPAFGRDGLLKPRRDLGRRRLCAFAVGAADRPRRRPRARRKIFADNCAACHGPTARATASSARQT